MAGLERHVPTLQPYCLQLKHAITFTKLLYAHLSLGLLLYLISISLPQKVVTLYSYNKKFLLHLKQNYLS